MERYDTLWNNRRFPALVLLIATAVFALLVIKRSPIVTRTPLRTTGQNGKEMPANTDVNFKSEVERPAIFTVHYQRGDERFRLLGVKDPGDDERRVKAIRFVGEWLENAATNVAWFSNRYNALQDADGTWVVWVRALRSEKLCGLNVDLVQAGLADVDYVEYRDYEFREPLYGGFGAFVKWREELDEAARQSRNAK